MAIDLVGGPVTFDTYTNQTLPYAATEGNTLMVVAALSSTGVSDDAGNTWTRLCTSEDDGADGQRILAVYVCTNAMTTTSITVEATGNFGAILTEWSGVDEVSAVASWSRGTASPDVDASAEDTVAGFYGIYQHDALTPPADPYVLQTGLVGSHGSCTIGWATGTGLTGETYPDWDLSAETTNVGYATVLMTPSNVIETYEGGSVATLTLAAGGGGSKHAHGGAVAALALAGDGGGTTTRYGGADAAASLTAVSGGAKRTSGGSHLGASLSALGGGFKRGMGGVNVPFGLAAFAGGFKRGEGGTTATVNMGAVGGGDSEGLPPPEFTAPGFLTITENLAGVLLTPNHTSATVTANTAALSITDFAPTGMLVTANDSEAEVTVNAAGAAVTETPKTAITWRYEMSQWKTGDTYPDLEMTLTSGGSPVDLTSATSVELHASPSHSGTPTIPAQISASMTLSDAANGVVTYQWKDTDLTTAGTWAAEAEVTWSDGSIQTFPVNGYATFTVYAEMDGGA